jgi:hypothetical protein
LLNIRANGNFADVAGNIEQLGRLPLIPFGHGMKWQASPLSSPNSEYCA